uniref:Protein-serine O-palmitoleoyltransferase porcupine-like n=1 Tax=Sinocyclocheilus anshuiensis TaxID=1608454 RepID=A0A671R377_9TELE
MGALSKQQFFQELGSGCLLPTVQHSLEQVWQLLLICLVCRLLWRLGLPSFLKHLSTVAGGFYTLYLFFELHMVWVVLLSLLCYLILFLCRHSSSRGPFLSITILIYLLLGYIDTSSLFLHFLQWVHTHTHTHIYIYIYIFSFLTDLFSYSFLSKKRKISFVILLIRWLQAYENTLSFHFSNYFVSYLGEMSTTLAGAGFTEEKDNLKWDLTIAKPLNVEFPRSMVEVVTSWNLPMSRWLNTCISKALCLAVQLTNTSFQSIDRLSAWISVVCLMDCAFICVLVLRKRLSVILNACVLSKRCPSDCKHRHKKELWVYLINGAFSMLAVLHLTYLGSIFGSSTDDTDSDEDSMASHTIEKWTQLSWTSHWLTFGLWVLYRLIL